MDRDDGAHRQPPRQYVLRPVIEVDPPRRQESRQADVVPPELVVRRPERHVHDFHAERREGVGQVGEDDVLVAAFAGERSHELPRVRRRPPEDTGDRPDPDPHDLSPSPGPGRRFRRARPLRPAPTRARRRADRGPRRAPRWWQRARHTSG